MKGGGDGRVDMAEEVLQPSCTKGDMVELPREFLGLLDLEGVAVRPPGSSEEGNCLGNELWRYPDGHAMEIEDETEDAIDRGNEDLVQFIPRDGVLTECSV